MNLWVGYGLLCNVMVQENLDGSVRWELIDFNSFGQTAPNVQGDDRHPDVCEPLTHVCIQVTLLGLHWMFGVEQNGFDVSTELSLSHG